MFSNNQIDENKYKEEDQVLFLYTQLMNMPFTQIENISQIERSFYQELSINPNDRLAFIGLMQVQIMLGNHKKAQSFAYHIWDMGEQMGPTEEFLYINNLIDLGLLEMASMLLKPRFENLSQDIYKFFPIMVKFSTMTGNIYLLDRLLSNPNAPYFDEDYMKLVNYYKNYHYADYLKNIMKIIQETVSGVLCSCEYDISAGFVKNLEIYLYLSADKNGIEEIQEKIKEKIKAYYQSVHIEKIPNFEWIIHPISQHPEMGLN